MKTPYRLWQYNECDRKQPEFVTEMHWDMLPWTTNPLMLNCNQLWKIKLLLLNLLRKLLGKLAILALKLWKFKLPYTRTRHQPITPKKRYKHSRQETICMFVLHLLHHEERADIGHYKPLKLNTPFLTLERDKWFKFWSYQLQAQLEP